MIDAPQHSGFDVKELLFYLRETVGIRAYANAFRARRSEETLLRL
jgi:hypothetical protein